MLIARIEVVAVERSVRAPVIVSDEQLGFWGDFFLANPILRARGLTFERFLNHAVRNGALFEKLRHHRQHRHGRSAFRPRRDAL